MGFFSGPGEGGDEEMGVFEKVGGLKGGLISE